jgi:hypothetical protein
MRPTRLFTLALVSSVTVASTGCFLVAAGAGAGAAIAYTQRGASGQVPGSVDAVFGKAVSAFSQLGITETGRSTGDSGNTRTLVGKSGEQEVTVELKRASDETTAVEVTAKKNVVEYDKELAKSVLDTMVK